MEIICPHQEWSYDPDADLAKDYVRTIMTESSLPGYFNDLLMIVPTLRNELSSSHGTGVQQIQVAEHLVR